MPKLSSRDTIVAVGVGAAVILILFILFAVRPKLTEVSDLKAQQTVEEGKLSENKLKLQRLDAIRREAADIEAKRIALARRMPKDPEIPSFIVDLQKTANDADLDLTDVKLAEPAELEGYREVVLDLSGSASFYTLVDFLYRLEKMKREVLVDDLSLAVGEYPKLSVTIKARTFALAKPAAAVPPPAAGAGQAAAPVGSPANPAPAGTPPSTAPGGPPQ